MIVAQTLETINSHLTIIINDLEILLDKHKDDIETRRFILEIYKSIECIENITQAFTETLNILIKKQLSELRIRIHAQKY